MNALICPTVTAYSPHDYRLQLERVEPFAQRVHIDLMDGTFAGPRSVTLHELHWPEGLPIDLHVMYQHPARYIHTICALRPYSVILHAESDGDFMAMADVLHLANIGVGIALLPETSVETMGPALPIVDHVLIFSGKLGHNGGIADLNLLQKVQQLRSLKPELEIGWDGGVNASNVRQLIAAGVDVLNVGGFIQHAVNPGEAYATLEALT